MSVIEAESLSKVYYSGIRKKKQVHALHNFSVSIDGGQIFSLLGPNGAGKTTIIKILLSIVRPSQGTATILGHTVPDVKTRDRVGYLPENHKYPGYFTGEQVLRFFGELSNVPKKTLDERIPDLLHMVGLNEWRSMKVRKYSKGMLQRVGLAQALINDPDILFLDEPTDGVDPVGRKEIREVLKGLKYQGKTIFLNSHLLSEVEMISDQVAILDRGSLVRVGTVEELTTQGSSFEITFEGALPPAFTEEASAHVLKMSVRGKTISLASSTTADLNATIDLLRKHGVSITSLTKLRKSLEDSFIDLLKEGVKQ
ncbi:MAG TPA: ABC transporter ATP-binding protein [Bacteroidota bacterium]|jgi:ABC-2 type transport system ATP-binding protein